jgi:pyruvate,water dikinase
MEIKTPFIWLGSRRTRKQPLQQNAILLDQAANAGLPVPNGVILLDELFQLCADAGLVVVENGRIHIDSPQELHAALYQDIRLPPFATQVTIRPLALPQTPPIETAADQPETLSQTLQQTWQVIHQISPDTRKDVLLLATVPARVTGTVILGDADEVAATPIGQNTKTMRLPHLGRWRRADASLPPFAQRLQMLLRGVRRTFGTAVTRIHWADDGRICWLLSLHDQ